MNISHKVLLIGCYPKAAGDEERGDHVARAHLRMKPVSRKTDLRDVTVVSYNGIA